jgi:hypothetical protein
MCGGGVLWTVSECLSQSTVYWAPECKTVITSAVAIPKSPSYRLYRISPDTERSPPLPLIFHWQNERAKSFIWGAWMCHLVLRVLRRKVIRNYAIENNDWLQAGWPTVRSSSPGNVKNVYFLISSKPVLGPTQPSIQWAPWSLSLSLSV